MEKSEIAVISAVGLAVLTVTVITVLERAAVKRVDLRDVSAADRASLNIGDVRREDFADIEARGNWRVNVTQGDEQQVNLSYPEKIESRLRVQVENNRLVLAVRSDSWRFWRNWGSSNSVPTAHIVMPALDALNVSGASKVNFHGFSGDQLTIRVSGAGELDGADGHYEQLALRVSGAGDANMRDIVFTDARIRVSGAGKASLTMDGGVLSGRLSGAGKVAYYGSISNERITTSGAAVAQHKD